MRPAGGWIEGRLGLPIEPANVVLLGGEQQRFNEPLAPGAKNLAGNPGVHGLADGEDAGRLTAKQHAPFSANPFTQQDTKRLGSAVPAPASAELDIQTL